MAQGPGAAGLQGASPGASLRVVRPRRLIILTSPHLLQASSVTTMDVNQLRDALHAAAAESSALRAELAVQTAAAQDATLQAKQVMMAFRLMQHVQCRQSART